MARRPARKAAAAAAPPPKAPAGVPLVEFVPIDQLTAYARNAKQHPPEQVDQIAASMREFGWTIPALVDEDNVLIAGHGRILAARKLYDAGERLTLVNGEPIPAGFVPLLRAIGWPEVKRRAYVIADNKIGENAPWDEGLLKLELGDLKGLGFNLELTGFGAIELDGLLAAPIEPEAPSEFGAYGEDIETEHKCPKCGYTWSGKVS